MEGLQMAPVGSRTNGNTNRPVARKHWFFTLNNHTEDEVNHILECLAPKNVKYLFQEEIGEEEGTPHLQGTLSFVDKCRACEFIKNKRIHWESTRNVEASIKYCMKSKTSTGKRWTNMVLPRVAKPIDIVLKDWQLRLTDVFNTEPDDRKVFWVWDPVGGNGKTTFCKWMLQRHKDITYICATKSGDILTKANETSKLYMIDIPRCNEFSPYNAIEQLKNGLIDDCKLKKEARFLMIEPPHVFVFSNHKPECGKLSNDRLEIIDLSEPAAAVP